MDTDTGRIYPTQREAEADLREKGIPEKEIYRRLITGHPLTLRKLKKLILAQRKRERGR